MKSSLLRLALILIALWPTFPCEAQYEGWKHHGSVFLLTTPEGANLPATASLEGFPVLVRLHQDFFDFTAAQPHGEDLRFSSTKGAPLAYEIEAWDPAKGVASVWVRVPTITGTARQEIVLHWGKPDAASESNGKAVFNDSNGYLSVWHMNGPVKDVVGTLESKDVETTATGGMIGPARHLAGKQGIFCGEKISNYPSAAASHSSEAWFRAEKPNTTILGWGNEGGGRGSKVRMQLRSPPHVHIDSDFSDVNGEGSLPLGEWIHVAHTYDREDGKIYINGKLDGAAKPPLNIKQPARLWLGGWYHNYDFVGDLDEVRISKVARSADWVRLEYENQKPMQTLVGPIVQSGDAFSVSPKEKVTVSEGQSTTFTAKAGGAQKVYWTLVREGKETVVAVDRFTYTFSAGRVERATSLTLRMEAIYPSGTKTENIPLVIQKTIPDPVVTLEAPRTWDGRKTIELIPQITNLSELQAQNAAKLNYDWKASGLAVIKQVAPGKLVLLRAQNSGPLKITLAVNNGGPDVIHSATIQVTEPSKDAWIERKPGKDEKPENNQFYARDDHNEGTLYYNGKLAEPAATVFLKLYADEKLIASETQKPAAVNSYAFSLKLKPGLIKYKVEFGTKSAEKETVTHTAANLVCGDAYIIIGQSNAVATDWGPGEPTLHSPWIRSFGSMSGSPEGVRVWGEAVHRSRDAEKLQIGYWGMELAQRLVEGQKIPICILNGAVGGTRIDQHQRNAANPTDMTTIYGRLLWRVQEAHLTHGIRGIFWHQGENDQGADGPTGGFGWETYQQYFIDLAAAWKQDYPNIQHYYAFQIWPKACAMGFNGSDNRLREVQRNLPRLFSNLSVMSTLGIKPPGGCHYPAEGYVQFAKLIGPLVERDLYGAKTSQSITPPNLQRVKFSSESRDELILEFDQPVVWADSLINQFYLDGQSKQILSGATSGNRLVLKLKGSSKASSITYLDSASWTPENVLRGTNSIAALTFCEVPIDLAK